MKSRRDFIKFGGVCAAAALAPVFIACGENKGEANANGENNANSTANSASASQNSANSSENLASAGVAGAVLSEFFTLSNGVKIPKLGLGLWRIDNTQVPSVIDEAIKVGYRHFDSAQAYENDNHADSLV